MTGDGVRVGCHLVSWPRLRVGLDAAATLGVRGVESFASVAATYRTPEDDLGDLLAARGLDLAALYADLDVGVGTAAARRHALADAGRWAALAAGFGARTLVVTPQPEGATVSVVRAALAAAGATAADHGVVLCVHPHAGSAVATAVELEGVLAGTDPDLVRLCVDTAHLTRGGAEPSTIIRRHAERVAHVHLHDTDPGGRDAVLGAGVARVADAVRALQDGGYHGWAVVELEDHADPTAGMAASLDWLETLGWVGGVAA